MKLITTVLLFLLVQHTFAQSSYFTVMESQKYPDQFKFTDIRSVNSTMNKLNVIVRTNRNVLIFETYDENAKGKNMMVKELETREVFSGELYYDDEVKIFTVASPSKTERIVYCHIYNVNDHSHKRVELLKTTVEKKSALFSGQNKRQTNFAISPNGTHIAIATDDIKKNSNSYLVHVFDAQTLQLIYSKNYYSNPDNHFQSTDMVVDDTGHVYSIGKEYFDGKRERKNDKANYSFVLHKVTQDAILSQKIPLESNEYIQSLAMTFNANHLRLIGYYSEKNAFGIKGVSQFKVNENDLSILDKKKAPLPLEVYKDIYGDENAGMNKGRELTNFDLDHILVDEEGNTYLVAEEFYITQLYVPGGVNSMGTYTYTFHYDDILISKFSAAGELLWGRSIFKRANEPSYNVFLKDNQLHVLLNSGKNLIEKNDGRLKVSKGWFESSALYDFVYDGEGNLVYEKIQDNTKDNVKYIPYRGNYAHDKFVMFSQSNSYKQLMILEPK